MTKFDRTNLDCNETDATMTHHDTDSTFRADACWSCPLCGAHPTEVPGGCLCASSDDDAAFVVVACDSDDAWPTLSRAQREAGTELLEPALLAELDRLEAEADAVLREADAERRAKRRAFYLDAARTFWLLVVHALALVGVLALGKGVL